MLQKTFLHCPGIGAGKEAKLKACGITDWEKARNDPGIGKHIEASVRALMERDHRFFTRYLPNSEHWRTYKYFNPCFLDIETTGLSREFHDITIIGLYDGKEPKIFVKGQNMDDFPQEIAKHQLIVTFNGQGFDLPFIAHKFPTLDLSHLHIDLRWVLKRLGYTGGLKRIEKEVGIQRGEEIDGVDGFEAVRLWRRYQKGDEAALKKLIDYNIADIVNLKTLMDFAYEKLAQQ